jgi:hypothetical protein
LGPMTRLSSGCDIARSCTSVGDDWAMIVTPLVA